MSQEKVIDLEEEISEEEDDPLVNLVKPSVAEKLRTRQGKSVAKMRTGRVKKNAGIGPSKAWSKVEVRKRKERDSSDSEEDVEDDVPDISPAKRKAVQKSPGKAAAEEAEKAGRDSNKRSKSQSSGSSGSSEDSEGAGEDTSEGEGDSSSSD
ncbi:uncharacterized protein LOC127101854 [Lathyrus oleraceus]|uniref:uncharacterized protein LOC127101854 n=1 Tax=Pisum sativum TaxID=3888 RepID=UPI0021D099E0|nr:uncharacterized protein LOC127101854 [Pisum sativum]